MVKHVLMIKLKDNAQAECEKLRDLFLTMKGRVPQVIDVEAARTSCIRTARSTSAYT